jgi:hypothetical protein
MAFNWTTERSSPRLSATSVKEPELTDGVLPYNPGAHPSPSPFYSSFSGADIVCTVAVPGVTAPVTFGTLRSVSYSIVRDKRAVRILGTANPIGWSMSSRLIAGTLIFTSFDRYVWLPVYASADEQAQLTPKDVVLADTLPPFDITISALNEYGQMSRMVIRGARIVDEGGVMSVDDMYIEQTHTYVALDVVPWIPTIPIEETSEDYPQYG